MGLRMSSTLRIVALLAFTSTAAEASDRGVPHYVDVTEAAGIRFRHVSGDPERKDHIFEAKGGGIGFFDYDNDGWLDLFLVQGSTVEEALKGEFRPPALYRNRRDGTFEEVTGGAGLTATGWGMGVTFGDVANDGYADIYLTQLGQDVLYRNRGDGTFSNVTAESGIDAPGWSTSAAFADYDRDGWLDLYVAGYLDYGPHRLPPKTADCTYLGEAVLCGPRGLRGAANHLFRNRGDGTFVDVTASSGTEDRNRYFGLGVVWADLNDNGRPDLIVANDATPNLVFVNNGDGTFTEMGLLSGLALSGEGNEQASMGVDAADYDNDGRLDVFMTHFARDHSTLYRNDGDLFFRDVTGPAGIRDPEWFLVSWGTRFTDVNHDGWKDIVHANGHVYPYLMAVDLREKYRQPNSLYINRGDGTFGDASRLAGPDFAREMVGRGVAFGDFDNDGDIDFAVAQLDGSPRLFRADRTEENHWVMLRLEGTDGNRDALGARASVECGGLRQIWEIKRSVGIYSASDPRAHFGLGGCSPIEWLTVQWPGGGTQEFTGVDVDRHYLLREGEDLQPEPIRRD